MLDASLSAIALPGIVMFPESDRSLDELVYQDKLFFQEWRQPAPSQLACEQELERLLKMFIGGMRQGKRLEQPTDTECTELAEKIIPLFVQAEALGQQFARKQGTIQTQEAFTDWLKRASDLVERVIEWAKQLFGSKVEDLGDDATGDELEQAISDVADTVAETLAPTEIQDVIEQTVLDTFQARGVEQVMVVNSPGACQRCQDEAAKGAQPIDEVKRPPLHARCRCTLSVSM